MEAFQSDYASDLLKGLLERLNSLVFDEAGQVIGFDGEDEVTKLVRKLRTSHALLHSCQLTANKDWQLWVGDVTRVCYDVEDLADDITLEASKTSSVLEKIVSFFSRGNMTRKIRELQDRFDDITKGLDMLNNTNQQAQQYSMRYLKGVVDKNQRPLPDKLFGRDTDKEKIIAMLLQETISSVSIVGLGGLGKTTLAQYVLTDSRIQSHFHNKVWISLNARFNLDKMEKGILKRKQQCEYSFLPNEIQELFRDQYMGKNVLIVLDDVWDVNYTDWSSFSSQFLNSSGCKVLTTSNLNVALVTKSIPYHLQILSDEYCLAIINDKVLSFNILSERQRATLEDVARVMAQKCKGLPLAANILGLLLSSKYGDDDWVTLLERDICELKVFKEEIFPVFRLNNPNLASHLKKCLAYCSLFPRDFEFKKHNLVQLWMAEGYLLHQETINLEQIGCEYFDELLWRSIFQLSQPGDQETPAYKMHEFIHKFVEVVASDTCYRLEKDEWSCSVTCYKLVRHLSLLCDRIKPLFLKEIEKCEGLRTLLLLSEQGTMISQVPYSLFQKLERLRVLELSRTDIDELPESLGRLKHLRYLDASQTHISRLPISASDLHVLQVLKLRDCSELLELPKNLKSLTNLIHLDVDIKGLRCMPRGIGSLNYLKTLPAFIIGKKEGYRITELKNLKHLRGTICLIDLEKVKDGAEAREGFISNKPYIKRLELEWSRCSRDESKAMEVLVGLQPHKNLKELHVINYGGSSFPAWLTSSSCMLVSIYIQNCRQDGVLPSLGQLPFLKTLHIEGMHRVKYVDCHFCGETSSAIFPSLESLKIQDMSCLTSWNRLPNCSMPQLRDLTVEDCPNLLSIQSLNHMTSLQALEINQCQSLRSLPELPISIQSLIIIESDIVKEQCQPEVGPQWRTIDAIPYVEIDYEIVRTEDLI